MMAVQNFNHKPVADFMAGHRPTLNEVALIQHLQQQGDKIMQELQFPQTETEEHCLREAHLSITRAINYLESLRGYRKGLRMLVGDWAKQDNR